MPDICYQKVVKRVWLLALASIIFVLLSTVTIAMSSVTGPELLQNAVTVDITGPAAEQIKNIEITADAMGKDQVQLQLTMRCLRDKQNLLRWSAPKGRWIKFLTIHGCESALDQITSLKVKAGNLERTFNQAELKTWTPARTTLWALPHLSTSVISLVIPAVVGGEFQSINMPSLSSLMLNAFVRALVFTAIALALFAVASFFLRISSVQALLVRMLDGQVESDAQISQIGVIPLLFGLVVVAVGLLILYVMLPYPFTQDDSFTQFLPVVVRSMETAATGNFPTWNPYQLLGAPTTTVGIYALTYPPLHLAYWAAHALLQNDNATIEIFCVAHLVCAYVVTYFALRRAVSPWLAASGGLCWALSGWFLVAGRSQFNFIPYAVFLPLLIALINRLGRAPASPGWILATGLSAGLLFHAGHAEFWIYTIIFGSLAVLLMFANKTIDLSRLIGAAAAALLAVATASPLLWLQKWETDDIVRSGGTGWPADFVNMLLPFVGLSVSTFKFGSVNWQYYPAIHYAGTVFCVVGVALLILCAAAFIWRPGLIGWRHLAKNQWLSLGWVAFVMSLGAPAVLWTAMSFLPIFNRFRWPIKYTSFLHIFLIFGAALVLERLLPRKAKLCVFALAACLMLFNVTQCKSALYDFADRPYPSLPPSQAALLKSAENSSRIYSISPFHSPTNGFVNSLVLNFPTEYRLFSSQGYDTFVSSKPLYLKAVKELDDNAIEAARSYGLEWLIWSDLEASPVLSNPCLTDLEISQVGNLYAAAILKKSGSLAYREAPLNIYRLAANHPLVFISGQPQAPLKFSADQAGLLIDTSGLKAGTTITANFLCWPWITAQAGGDKLVTHADKWNRIEVTLPAQSAQVAIRYSPPWAKSSMIGLAILVVAIITAVLSCLLQKRKLQN